MMTNRSKGSFGIFARLSTVGLASLCVAVAIGAIVLAMATAKHFETSDSSAWPLAVIGGSIFTLLSLFLIFCSVLNTVYQSKGEMNAFFAILGLVITIIASVFLFVLGMVNISAGVQLYSIA